MMKDGNLVTERVKKFRDVGIRDYEFSTGEEVCITHPKGILRIQKLVAEGFRRGRK